MEVLITGCINIGQLLSSGEITEVMWWGVEGGELWSVYFPNF